MIARDRPLSQGEPPGTDVLQDAETKYDCWFLHDKLLVNLLTVEEAEHTAQQLPGPEEPLGAARRTAVLERALRLAIAGSEIASVDEEHLKSRLHLGQLVWLEQAIAFKGVSRASWLLGSRGMPRSPLPSPPTSRFE
jgi:hypothetical protein